MTGKGSRKNGSPQRARVGRSREHERDMAERLAPLEETEAFRRSRQGDGLKGGSDDTIRVGGGSVRVPGRLVEDEGGAGSVFRLEPVAWVILLLALAFIAFVAWQITLMPEK